MFPAYPPLPVPSNLPFHPELGIHSSMLITESGVGFETAETLQNSSNGLWGRGSREVRAVQPRHWFTVPYWRRRLPEGLLCGDPGRDGTPCPEISADAAGAGVPACELGHRYAVRQRHPRHDSGGSPGALMTPPTFASQGTAFGLIAFPHQIAYAGISLVGGEHTIR